MAYGMYGYQPGYYQPPIPDQLAQLRQQYQPQYQQPPQAPQQQNGNGVLWVQGEAGAKSFMVAPGNSVMLMDSESNTFYLKSCDQSGMPSMRVFDYQERTNASHPASHPANQIKNPEYVTWDAYNELVSRLDALSSPQKLIVKTAKEDEGNG